MPVPLFPSSHARYAAQLRERIGAVIETGRYILGPEVEAFEREFADYLGAKHAIGVANGTEAITIALRALGVGPGDEVVVPSFTFYASAEAVVNAGAAPVFCDIDPDTFCVTAETVERAITPATKAIIAVHLFGNVAPVPDLERFGLPIVEDAAQAAGASLNGTMAGALGSAATFSFFPSKNLFCLGDGGAITTNDDEIAATVKRLRFHGSEDKQTFVDVGFNSRLDEIQAAALRVFLPELDGWTEARRAVAQGYSDQGLGDLLQLPRPVDGAEPVYHLYVARSPQADELLGQLAEAGVEARSYYRKPVHLQPAMRPYGGDSLDLPGTALASSENLALPMGTDLPADAVAEVVDACKGVLAR
jgi:dTDP-3-amino-3,4,6-trideoxy-alpha-D-glucose transaminase